jgi:FlgD Ig-like domain
MKRLLVLLALLSGVTAIAETPPIRVAVAPAALNAAAGERAVVRVTLARAGLLSVRILDRDGFVVRTVSAAPAPAGVRTLLWDGRADDGSLVPDEAYSIRADWSDGRESASYFPSNEPAAMTSIPVRYDSAASGTIVYDLPSPSRVHLQAGTAVRGKNGLLEGPVLKTVVNREPRAAGRIAEHWNGMDESGTVLVRDLPNFVLAVAATPLPESSIILFGNRARGFLAYAAARRGTSLFTPRTASHAHHAGLGALADVSPPLRLEPLNAKWSAAESLWIVDGPALRLRVVPDGVPASQFMKQPARVYTFAGTTLLDQRAARGNALTLSLPLPRMGAEPAVVAVNWRSDYGGVAANALRVRLAAPAAGVTNSSVRAGALR